jgi:hypothetical protein
MTTRTVVTAVFLLLPALLPASRAHAMQATARPAAARIPPDPDHPEAFFATEDLSDFDQDDELDYPVPKGIDRRPGFPPGQTKAPATAEIYPAIDDSQ